ncbi:MAG: glycosyltransferase [Phycisphaerales bacterium]|nr:glycosyltransferase [Phycisphaerales bacterium]
MPYIFSLFYQNKERAFVERFEHEVARPGDGASVLERSMRVSLFTDTLGDVNGVSRFIQDVAGRARATGRDLQVITSTRLAVPSEPNIFNFEPVFATSMPRYQNLEVVFPPLVPILRHLDRHQPDCIHISTPGPVGLIGFPGRPHDYVESLARLGLDRDRCCALMPGFESGAFHPRFRDRSTWDRFPAMDPESVKVLYVGRVSLEKNLPFLTALWKQAQHRLVEQGLNAELVVVGDGPYRERMQQELRKHRAHFLGFRKGDELSTLYASSDIFVFPSVTDTLGQVVMESQGSGLPVLVTDQGGPKEVVDHGRTGYVLSTADPNAWVERIVGLVADDERRARMGAAAHESMQRFSLSNSFEHFWDVHTNAWRHHLASRGILPQDPGPQPTNEPGPELPPNLWGDRGPSGADDTASSAACQD